MGLLQLFLTPAAICRTRVRLAFCLMFAHRRARAGLRLAGATLEDFNGKNCLLSRHVRNMMEAWKGWTCKAMAVLGCRSGSKGGIRHMQSAPATSAAACPKRPDWKRLTS